MSQDDELARWSSDFRASEEQSKLPTAEEILAESRKDDRRRIVDWVAQLVGTAFAALVFGWIVVFTRSALFAGFAAFVLPVLFALSGYFVYLRLDERRVRMTAVRDHVDRAVRQRRIRHRFMRVSLWALALLTLGFWVWVPFVWLSRWERIEAAPWRLVVAVSFAILVFASGFAWAVRQRRKTREELEKWEAIASAMRDE
jgi:MFS family permease